LWKSSKKFKILENAGSYPFYQLKTREMGTSKGDGGEENGERGIEGQAIWCSGNDARLEVQPSHKPHRHTDRHTDTQTDTT